jgi:hypothetical protein
MASAALMAGSVVTTGGVTALVARLVGRKTGKNSISNHLDKGSRDHDYIDEQNGTFDGRFPRGMAGGEERVAER